MVEVRGNMYLKRSNFLEILGESGVWCGYGNFENKYEVKYGGEVKNVLTKIWVFSGLFIESENGSPMNRKKCINFDGEGIPVILCQHFSKP